MTSLSYNHDRNEIPLDADEYEYAGDDNDDRKNDRVDMYDDDEDSNDDDQIIQNNNAEHLKSHTSFNDETNLIDYVIEEEQEIGGAKGEDSYATSRSTTYSSLISNDEEEEEERITPDETITIQKQKITTKEEAQMIRARAFLNRLDNKVQEKDDLVKKIRYSYV
jgi:hypothetical protein